MRRTKNHRGHKRRGHTIRRKSHARVKMSGGYGCKCDTDIDELRKKIVAAMESNTTKIVAAIGKLNDNLVIIARNSVPGIFSA
jgi:hypothetical protein